MAIPFTQYVLPNGRKKLITIDRSEDIETKAARILEETDYRFEIEVLRSGKISMDCCNHEAPVAIEICDKEQVRKTVDKLVQKAYDKLGFK